MSEQKKNGGKYNKQLHSKTKIMLRDRGNANEEDREDEEAKGEQLVAHFRALPGRSLGKIRIDKFFSFLYGPVVYRRKLKIFGRPV